MIETIRAAIQREMDKAGIKAKTLSREAGLNECAVRDLLQKVEDPRIGTLLALAKALDVPPGHLFEDFVKVCGLVGAEGRVQFLQSNEALEEVPRPPTASLGELIALKVIAEGLMGHRKGDILYISRQHDSIAADAIANESVVETLDGRAYLRVPTSSHRPGHMTLHGLNVVPHEERITWAAPVLFTMRGLNGRKIGEI